MLLKYFDITPINNIHIKLDIYRISLILILFKKINIRVQQKKGKRYRRIKKPLFSPNLLNLRCFITMYDKNIYKITGIIIITRK